MYMTSFIDHINSKYKTYRSIYMATYHHKKKAATRTNAGLRPDQASKVRASHRGAARDRAIDSDRCRARVRRRCRRGTTCERAGLTRSAVFVRSEDDTRRTHPLW